MTVSSGSELLVVASVLLPIVDAEAGSLRWELGINCSAFAEIIGPTIWAVMHGDDDAAEMMRTFPFPLPSNVSVADYSERLKRVLRHRTSPSPTLEDNGAVTQCCALVIAVFYAADENGSGALSWEELTDFLVDSAIACGSLKHGQDDGEYALGKRLPFRAGCGYATALDEGRLMFAFMSYPLELRIVAGSGCRKLASVDVPYLASAVVLCASRHVVAFCCDIAVFFLESKTLREISRIGFESLNGTARSLYWSDARNTLFVGGREGELWEISPPAWNNRIRQWTTPTVDSTTHLVAESILALVLGATEGLLFAVSFRGTLTCFNVTTSKPMFTASCASAGANIITGMCYNPPSNYIVVCGECPHLIAWVARNLPNQQPMIMEDIVCPHASRVMGIACEPNKTVVASIDNRGIFKIWDLGTLRCVQTLRVLMAQADFVALVRQPKEFVLVLQKEIVSYMIDESALDMPVQRLVCGRVGGSVFGASYRDVVQWSATNGQKIQRHQSIASTEICAVCFADASNTLFVVTKQGEVSSHSASSGKRMFVVERTVMKSEPLTMLLCLHHHKLVIPTVNADVWFFPTVISTAEVPLRFRLASGDTTCTCITTALVDHVALYFVGTAEGSVQVLQLKLGEPRLLFRVCATTTSPPPREPVTAVVGSHGNSANMERGVRNDSPVTSHGPLGNSDEPQHRESVTSLVYCNGVLLVADSAGWFRSFSPSLKMKLLSEGRTHVGSGAGNKDGDSRRSSGTAVASPSTKLTSLKNGDARSTTCLAAALSDCVVVAGDDDGWIQVYVASRRAPPNLVKAWPAHPGEVVCSLVVQGSAIFSAGESPGVSVWDLDGNELASLWGPRQFVAKADLLPALPMWMHDFLTAGSEEGSMPTGLGGSREDASRSQSPQEAQLASPTTVRGKRGSTQLSFSSRQLTSNSRAASRLRDLVSASGVAISATGSSSFQLSPSKSPRQQQESSARSCDAAAYSTASGSPRKGGNATARSGSLCSESASEASESAVPSRAVVFSTGDNGAGLLRRASSGAGASFPPQLLPMARQRSSADWGTHTVSMALGRVDSDGDLAVSGLNGLAHCRSIGARESINGGVCWRSSEAKARDITPRGEKRRELGCIVNCLGQPFIVSHSLLTPSDDDDDDVGKQMSGAAFGQASVAGFSCPSADVPPSSTLSGQFPALTPQQRREAEAAGPSPRRMGGASSPAPSIAASTSSGFSRPLLIRRRPSGLPPGHVAPKHRVRIGGNISVITYEPGDTSSAEAGTVGTV